MNPLDRSRDTWCRRVTALLALCSIVAVAGPARAAVAGSGTLRTETRAVSGFQAVAVSASMQVVLRQGVREGLELRGDDQAAAAGRGARRRP